MVLGDYAYLSHGGSGAMSAPVQQQSWLQQQQFPSGNSHLQYGQSVRQQPSQPFSLPVQPVVLQHQAPVGQAGQGPMTQQQQIINGQPVLVIRKPNEVFVGDLSYFCEEKDLFELFSQYGTVDNCRIVRNDSKNRSLMFGFVCMSNEQEAQAVAKVLHNYTFMGRAMKVELSEKRAGEPIQHKQPSYFNGYQVHVAFTSTFSLDNLIKPTETFLRKFFIQFGMITDVVVREYTIHQMMNKQEGFGFVTFENEESAVRAAHECTSIHYEGIMMNTTLSYRNKPTGKSYVFGGVIYTSLPQQPGAVVAGHQQHGGGGGSGNFTNYQVTYTAQYLQQQQEQQMLLANNSASAGLMGISAPFSAASLQSSVHSVGMRAATNPYAAGAAAGVVGGRHPVQNQHALAAGRIPSQYTAQQFHHQQHVPQSQSGFSQQSMRAGAGMNGYSLPTTGGGMNGSYLADAMIPNTGRVTTMSMNHLPPQQHTSAMMRHQQQQLAATRVAELQQQSTTMYHAPSHREQHNNAYLQMQLQREREYEQQQLQMLQQQQMRPFGRDRERELLEIEQQQMMLLQQQRELMRQREMFMLQQQQHLHQPQNAVDHSLSLSLSASSSASFGELSSSILLQQSNNGNHSSTATPSSVRSGGGSPDISVHTASSLFNQPPQQASFPQSYPMTARSGISIGSANGSKPGSVHGGNESGGVTTSSNSSVSGDGHSNLGVANHSGFKNDNNMSAYSFLDDGAFDLYHEDSNESNHSNASSVYGYLNMNNLENNHGLGIGAMGGNEREEFDLSSLLTNLPLPPSHHGKMSSSSPPVKASSPPFKSSPVISTTKVSSSTVVGSSLPPPPGLTIPTH